jgi:hypothetical protein
LTIHLVNLKLDKKYQNLFEYTSDITSFHNILKFVDEINNWFILNELLLIELLSSFAEVISLSSVNCTCVTPVINPNIVKSAGCSSKSAIMLTFWPGFNPVKILL